MLCSPTIGQRRGRTLNALSSVASLAHAAAPQSRKRLWRRLTVVSAILAALLVPAGALAQSTAVIDFEGLPAGKIVNDVASGTGISGAAVSGSVAVFGARADGEVTSNAAVVYDATCGGGGPAMCSGGEIDMHKPPLGNVLIIGRDLTDSDGDGLVDVPDVDNDGGEYRFDFSRFGPGTVTVDSLDVLDHEAGRVAYVELFAGGVLIRTVPIPGGANNAVTTVSIGVSGVDRMEVTLLDSGGIDNIRLQVGPPPPPPPPPAPQPPPVTPPAPPPVAPFQPPTVCENLSLTRRAASVGVRMSVRVRVRDQNRAPMARVRVRARGAGVRTGATTNAAGVARLTFRPRRAGTITIRAAGSPICVARLAVGGRFRPPPLTG
jgi:hypothetical protein